MFQLRRNSAANSNPTNIDPNTALPNSYGKIRTLKRDLEDFKAGKSDELPPSAVQEITSPPVQEIREAEKKFSPQPQYQQQTADYMHENRRPQERKHRFFSSKFNPSLCRAATSPRKIGSK